MQVLTYRRAELVDLDWLVETERRCFQQGDAFTRRTMRTLLKNTNNSVIFDILEVSRERVGYALYLTRQKSTLIRFYSLCLLPAHRGQGLVEFYLRERLQGFAEKYKKIGLEVRVSNTRAQHLYRKLGFTMKKVLAHYYPDGEDGYRMLKKLNVVFGKN